MFYYQPMAIYQQKIRMLKYRVLSKEELEPLNEEFLKYLLVANVTPQNWEALKENNHEAVEKHIEVFSNLVLDKILSDVNFVDIVLNDRIEVYQFLKEKAYIFIIENKTHGSFNFSTQSLTELNFNQVDFIKGEKEYSEDRELEVFKILQKENASISNGDLFKKIALLSV